MPVATPLSDGTTESDRHTVRAVVRALRILEAFGPGEQAVSLAELARRLGMEKSTVLRTARTLAASGYLSALQDGAWRLGPAAGELGVRWQAAFDTGNAIDGVLRRLVAATGETAALFVREGAGRTCVARVDRLALERHHIRVGERLPLERGASGRVLLAFSGEPGEANQQVRRRGWYVSVGERDRRMSSIAIPVFGARRALVGALCLSGTAERLGRDALIAHLQTLVDAGASLSRTLAASEPASRPHRLAPRLP